MQLQGKVVLFGDDVNTDVLHPSRFYSLDKLTVAAGVNAELRTSVSESTTQSPESKILVAGRNFGYGSSRETTLQALQANGVVAVIAATISRIFWRNALNAGLWVFECHDPAQLEQIRLQPYLRIEGRTAEVFGTGGTRIAQLPELDAYELELLQSGGLLDWMARASGD